MRNPSKKLLEFIIDTVTRDERAAITQIVPEPNGFDYYLSSQKYLQILGRKIRANFSGEYRLTSTLHTENKMGDKLYRITILFREYPFKKGSVVLVHGDRYVVVSAGQKIYCKNEKSGKKEWFAVKDVKNLSH